MKYKSFKEFNSTTPCKCGGNCQCGTTTTTEVNESADQKKFKQFWDKSPETAIRKTFGKDYDKAIDNRVSLLLTIVNDPDDAEKYSEMDFLSLPSGISSQLMNMDPKDIDSILDESLVAEGKSYQEKFKDEASTYQEMINDPSKRVYDIVDFAQFTTGGMTEKQWEMFMYGRYAKHRDDTDTKTKEKMYKVLTKWLSESEVNEKDDAATHLDNLADLVGNAKSFMEVGKELKAGKYKYDFSTGMMPMYMIHADGFKFAILNKKYVDDGDREVGDIAIGLMESLVNEKDDAGTHLKDLPKLLAALDKKKNGELYNEPKITDNGKRGHYLGLTTHAGPNHKNYFTDLIKKLGFKNVEFDGKETNGSTHLYGWIIKESKLTEKFNFSKKEVEAAANLIASAISQADKVKAKVHDLEYVKGKGAGFEISINGEEFEGGSYTVKDNGDVVNAAIGNSHPNAVYNTIGNKDIADVFINMEKYESVVTESKITLKRRYTENHPALTVGKHAKIRNKMLEAIGDGNITQEEFNNILKELSTNGKRWTKSNSKYFSVSEEGISLTKFGSKALASITVNEEEPINTKPLEMKLHEATDENPKIWVPGGFDKAISKLPNSQITRDVVLKVAKKHKVNPEEAISYVEYGWSLDLNENKNKNMKTKFIYESFGDFINSLNESESLITEAFKSSKLRNLLTMTDSMTYGDKADAELPKAFYQLTKMKLDQIGDEDLIDMTPKEAYKAYANDRDTVVFYIVDNDKANPFGTGSVAPGVLALTRGKDFLGVKYESTGYRRKSNTKTLKGGDDRMAVGGNKAYKGYDATGVSSIKRAADLADRAVAFSLSNLTKSSRSEIAARVDQKSGATAFMNDKDFKDANKARYQEILATKASKLPLDKMVADSIDALTAQIKDGLAKNEKGRYGDIIIGRNSKGREAKMRDASNHMSTILDDYGRYVDYIKQAEEAKAEKYASNYAEKEAKNYAKEIKDKVSKIKKFDYAW